MKYGLWATARDTLQTTDWEWLEQPLHQFEGKISLQGEILFKGVRVLSPNVLQEKKIHAVNMCKRAGKHFPQQKNNCSMGKMEHVFICAICKTTVYLFCTPILNNTRYPQFMLLQFKQLSYLIFFYMVLLMQWDLINWCQTMVTSSSICRMNLGVWTGTTNCYYSKYNRWVGNDGKRSKEECLVRLWSLFSSVKLQIVSMACHSLRLCWVENESQESSKQLETDVRDINNLPKWKKNIKGQGERKIRFMVLETAFTSWKWCINPWWYEGITCDEPCLWEDRNHLTQLPKSLRYWAPGKSSSSSSQMWNHWRKKVDCLLRSTSLISWLNLQNQVGVQETL